MGKILQAKNVLKVALYIRVSTQEQAKEGYSIGEQETRLKKYAEAMNWEIYKIYVDPGYSGGDINRPGLTNMIKDVEDGLVDKVVVYKLDRLSRSQLDTLYLIEKVFLVNNTDFVSMSENFDTSTPFGRAMIGILAVFAQLEREQIKERMGMGKEARAKEGKWGGGASEPIGYDYNPNKDLLEVNTYEAMQIEELIEMFLKGVPYKTIADTLNRKGYTYRGTSNRVSQWDAKRVKYVLTNKTYLGYIRYHDQWYKAEHEPIIDEDTFELIQKVVADREEKNKIYKNGNNGKQTTYLGGFIFCKHCGGRYCRQSGKKWKDNAPPLYYSCYSRNKSVPKMIKDPNCKNKNWRMTELDDIVIGEIQKLAMDPDYIHKIRRDKMSRTDTPNKIDTIKNEIANIDDQISRFMDLYGIGKFTIDQVSGKIDPLNEQRKGLEKELEDINSSLISETSVEDAIEIIKSFGEVFERGDFNEIRFLIESLIYYIELDNEDVYIHWKFA